MDAEAYGVEAKQTGVPSRWIGAQRGRKSGWLKVVVLTWKRMSTELETFTETHMVCNKLNNKHCYSNTRDVLLFGQSPRVFTPRSSSAMSRWTDASKRKVPDSKLGIHDSTRNAALFVPVVSTGAFTPRLFTPSSISNVLKGQWRTSHHINVSQ